MVDAARKVHGELYDAIASRDGETAVRTRNQLLDRIEAEGLVLSACHFPEPGFGRVVRLEGRRSWRAL